MMQNKTNIKLTELVTRNTRLLIFALPFVILAFYAVLWVCSQELFHAFGERETIGELIQEIALFVATIICIRAFIKIRESTKFTNLQKVFVLLLGIGCFLIGMEEIAWGQKFIQFQTPGAIQQINVQDEMTFHNLAVFQESFLLHISFVVFALCAIFSKQIIGLLPVKIRGQLKMFAVPSFLFSYFAPVAIYYLVLDFVNPQVIEATGIYLVHSKQQEVYELVLYLGVLAYVLILGRGLK